MSDRNQQLAIIRENVVQMSNLVKLSRSEMFSPEYRNDCSEDDEIACLWSLCKQKLNSNASDLVESCSKVKLWSCG
jgi:hypothetical protein